MDNYLQIMIDSLVQKLEYLKEIEQKSKEQGDMLHQQMVDMQGIDQNMDEKALLIQKIQPLDEGFDQTYDRVKEELLKNQALYKTQIQRLQKLISQITETSASIQALEKRNKAEMEKYFQREKKELQTKKNSMRAAQDYYASMNKVSNVAPQFMDHRQ